MIDLLYKKFLVYILSPKKHLFSKVIHTKKVSSWQQGCEA